MASSQTTIIPHSQKPFVTREYPSEDELNAIIAAAADAQNSWSKTALSERLAICKKFLDEMKKMEDVIAKELTIQMGRPLSQTPGELRGFVDRANYLLSIAESCLQDIPLTESDKPGFRRYIRRVPYGVAFLIVPWNYPYLTTVNSLIPALLAGNTALLKPSPQTPLTAERISEAFQRAGLPENVLQVVHLSPELVKYACRHPSVKYISFTGSVSGGRDIDQAAAASGDFKTVGLELGGKDPAYVRADANVDYAVAELVDGALFNSGQSCCAVERIYVHEAIFDEFTRKFVDLVKTYKLGDPTESGISLGPVVSVASAKRIRDQVQRAVAAGAKPLIPEELFPVAKSEQFLAMDVVTEETFGPIAPIMKVSGDEEAVQLMNDSKYGLTASVWTTDEAAFESLVDKIDAGTVFSNRCDYLDPALAWTGVKHSGRGISLSKYGFDQVTRAKSVHIKTSPPP
ncbi:4-hydroxybenzaldehyde dehydrogenase (NADP(+)) {ECO:0000303/PubMed:23736872} Short=PHBDD {ECO:0000303/PubMed:23736872}; {ECO:0000269/PubMed:23736872} [Serendipita indica DSM 11827]|nr:4-hydroxybenzaldehyde dehydrogenase (NADP(+)) {ECO:0000303/PubMed:23736872} Short=PHBDD {ECO:0000303/PubMed:23736872}; {ECO:0000269/PubMed:23736872} [Serendipita indica DSM 11827]